MHYLTKLQSLQLIFTECTSIVAIVGRQVWKLSILVEKDDLLRKGQLILPKTSRF